MTSAVGRLRGDLGRVHIGPVWESVQLTTPKIILPESRTNKCYHHEDTPAVILRWVVRSCIFDSMVPERPEARFCDTRLIYASIGYAIDW